jgi:endonuclease/exonuclease/phosphatase family metal-dependent hydrolase
MGLNLCVASANLQHWIRIGGVMIDGKNRKEGDYNSKMAWAQQLFSTTKPDIIGLQEIYDQESVADIFSHPAFENKEYHIHLSGGPPQQVAIATTLELAGAVEAIHELSEPISIDRNGLQLSVSKLSRPILKARLRHEGDVLTVFVVHLKSKLPSFGDDPNPPQQYEEELLLDAKLEKRCLGNLVSLARRGAEAAALRREVVRELETTDNPVIVFGDMNDSENSVTTEMIMGDPVSTYIPPRKDGTKYTKEEIEAIRRRLHRTVLTSAREIHIKSTALNQLYTNVHAGKYSSLDSILLSRHFFRAPNAVVDEEFSQRYYFNYFDVANDHLVDNESMFAPRKPMTSDHGPVFAYLKKIPSAPEADTRIIDEAMVEAADMPESPADLDIR